MTSDEFTQVMKVIKNKALALAKSRPRAFPGGVRFLMDNARFHARAVKELKLNCVEIPPQSPDCNKVVEHCFNSIKMEFWKRYNKQLKDRKGFPIDWQEAKVMLPRVVKDVVTAERVDADAKTLIDTYKAIVANKGSYIEKKLS